MVNIQFMYLTLDLTTDLLNGTAAVGYAVVYNCDYIHIQITYTFVTISNPKSNK